MNLPWSERGAGSRFTIITPQQQTRQGFMVQEGFHNWYTTVERGPYCKCALNCYFQTIHTIWIMSKQDDSIDRGIAVLYQFSISIWPLWIFFCTFWSSLSSKYQFNSRIWVLVYSSFVNDWFRTILTIFHSSDTGSAKLGYSCF